ncbi:MAG: hypothetical protein GY793_12375 [Proteobacteria bacterium]|nr:hypothetical protein [Pseudomonadota bacterium]
MHWISWLSFWNFSKNQSNGICGNDPNKGWGRTNYPRNHKSAKLSKKKKKNRSGKKARKANRSKGGK